MSPYTIQLDSVRSHSKYSLHRGRGRKVQLGQKIHASVVFSEPNYQPKAALPEIPKISAAEKWHALRRVRSTVTSPGETGFVWPDELKDLLEEDIFDVAAANVVVENLENSAVDALVSVRRLTVLTCSSE